MARQRAYRLDADCGCSLIACHDGLIANPEPRLHLLAVMEPELRRRYSGDDNVGARVGFNGMLGLEGNLTAGERFALNLPDVAMQDDWKALIRGAV